MKQQQEIVYQLDLFTEYLNEASQLEPLPNETVAGVLNKLLLN